MSRTSLLILALYALGASVEAQAPLPGRSSEILGLQTWTLQTIHDTLAKYAPGEPLESQHCVGVLLGPLRFPDAAWITHPRGTDRPTDFTQILVLEPGDSTRIRFRPAQTDTLALPEGWEDALALVERGASAVDFLFRQPWLLSAAGESAPDLQRSPTGIHLAKFVRRQQSDSAYAFAKAAALHDARVPVRLLALLVLASAPQRDATWHTLVAVLRDRAPIVRLRTPQLLTGLTARYARAVDWAPATEDLAAILDGTNLWAFGPTLSALSATGVPTSLSAGLLRGRGRMLLIATGSLDIPTRTAAFTVLRQLRGQDLGADPNAWRQWVTTL